jgi:CubicO group peptidase (beta-lactamase class C family)
MSRVHDIRRSFFLLTILFASLFPTVAFAQTARVNAKPVVEGGIGSKAEELLTRYAMYGMSGTVMIVKDGKVVFHKAYGLADRESGRPNTLATLYDVGSIAKTFTASAILQLETEGRLKTTDNIGKFLGVFPADKAGITIHQLLTHTSGLGLDAGNVGISPTTAPDEFMRKVKETPLLFAPGAQYSYSNLGYGLLAIIIEKLSGLSWQNYLRKNLLKRAGLSQTLLYGDSFPETVARGYIGNSEDELELEAPLRLERPDSYVWRKYTIGSGGVLSTTGDLYKWWQALHSDRVLSADARAKMFSVQAFTQGFGWNIQTPPNGTARTYRGGLRGSYQSMLGYYAKENTLLIFGLNKNVSEIGWAGVVWSNLEKLIVGKDYVVPPVILAARPANLARYAGNYELSNGEGFVARIEKNSLNLGAIGQSAVNFLAYPQQTPPAFLGDIAQTGKQVVELLGQNDLAQLTRGGFVAEKDLPILIAHWKAWMNTTGKLTSFQVLGVSPGSGGNPRTFVRLNGEKSSLVIRLLWNWNQKRVTAWGDNIPLPASVKLLPESESSFVNFAFDKSQTIRVRFDISTGVNGLILRSADGRSEVVARKTDRAPSSNEPIIDGKFQDPD